MVFFICGIRYRFGQIALGWCIIADENPDMNGKRINLTVAIMLNQIMNNYV